MSSKLQVVIIVMFVSLCFRNGANSSELIMAMRGLQVNGEAAQDQPKSEAKGNHEVIS